MPEKEGLETIIEFKRDFPTVHIIAMSGGSTLGQVNFLTLAQKLGARRVLEKPFSLEEILEAVQQACKPPD
jgi:FixJ family two-component response regulator